MQVYRFSITVTPESWLEFYRRPNSKIVATDTHGRTIQLSARHFQRFVSRDGLRGMFELTLDENNDLIDLKKVR